MTSRPNILITGASGFIGGHVVRHFVEKGSNAFCLVRENSNVDFIKDLPVNLIRGDISNYPELMQACSNMDYIIHTAGIASDWGSWGDFNRTNVEGTLNVLKAAVGNGIRDVIITGSVSSYGEENSGILKDESMPYNSHYPYFLDRIFPSGMNYYRDSKAISTRKAIDFAEANNINLTVIEPVWVYGENEFSSGFYEYLKTVKSGMRVMPGSKKNDFHVVYVGDLAIAYYKAYQKKLQGINRIIIGNATTEKMYRIFQLFCQEAGYRPPLRMPKAMLYPIAFIVEMMARITKSQSAPLLSRARLNMFYDNIAYSTQKAESLLSFKAGTSLETGIRKTVHWYKHHQHL